MAAPSPNDTVADALVRRVVTRRRRDPAAFGLADGLRELGAVDRAVYEAVARTPTGNLDVPVRRLSGAADKSRLWLGIAAVVAVAGGRRGRRAALEGVVAIGITSATVNLGVKPVARRRRPGRADPAAGRRRRLLPGPHRRPLPRRRGHRLGRRGRHGRHGRRRGRPDRPGPR